MHQSRVCMLLLWQRNYRIDKAASTLASISITATSHRLVIFQIYDQYTLTQRYVCVQVNCPLPNQRPKNNGTTTTSIRWFTNLFLESAYLDLLRTYAALSLRFKALLLISAVDAVNRYSSVVLTLYRSIALLSTLFICWMDGRSKQTIGWWFMCWLID